MFSTNSSNTTTIDQAAGPLAGLCLPELPAAVRSLFDAMDNLDPPPGDLATALAELPAPGNLPSPWATWLLISLLCHRKRQKWAKSVMLERMPEIIPPSRALRRREQPVQLPLPGSSEWMVSVECDGEFAELTNTVTRELITVDISSEQKDNHMQISDFLQRLDRPSRWHPAGRLAELHPDASTIHLAVRELEAAGVLSAELLFGDEPPEVHRISSDVVRRSDSVPAFVSAWAEPARRLWLAAVIGDWLLADELAQQAADAGLINVTHERAEACRKRREQAIREQIGDRPAYAAELYALNQIGASGLTDEIRRVLDADGSHLYRAVEFLLQTDDPRWCEQVYSILQRVIAEDSDEITAKPEECAGYLLRYGYQPELVISLLSGAQRMLHEAALLAWEYVPHLALPLMRRALRQTKIPVKPGAFLWQQELWFRLGTESGRMATHLALADTDWSRREIRAALIESDESDADIKSVLPLVLALAESMDAKTRQFAAGWKKRFDPCEYRFMEVAFKDDLDRSRDRVAKLMSIRHRAES